ncbi:DUF1648 domain-containing protein [Microbacterium pseudoresistens]|uniref:DUF1648 domain-containing protein n=1 Tax=Microbacterium pseudoresistens TaxID=640634 RepID=A0A7Y9JMZ5_9MICO|nr:DUF1648 domain-containing protein [Microbacterium pseudoresistens]NYD53109.1 hypothetical protein [Microbacterium pseudoresistens]
MTLDATAAARRSRTAFVWVGAIVPVVILAVATAVIIAWLPELPDPAATHWGAEGADAFGPRWTLALNPLIGVAVVALLTVITLVSSRMSARADGAAPRWSSTARFLGAMSLGTAGLIAFIALVTTAVQRGLSTGEQAPDVTGAVIAGLVLAVVLVVVGWLLQPASPTPVASGVASEPRIPLAAGVRAAWFGTASMNRAGVVVLLATLAVLIVVTAFAAARGSSAAWIIGAVTALVALLIGGTFVFRVRVNREGLLVRSIIGWPRAQIPLERIARIETTPLDPFREFGGWGWRIAVDGRRGVVLRAGEALQVTDTRGRVFVVTVDGASEAATVLESLRGQVRHDATGTE